jgi:tetratricopeptide (TPR) repeat protein
MDERLEAGRHHLANGEQAVRLGYPDDARMYFEAALLQFRGPELRLGEAHALRGLAQVALQLGEVGEAERLATAAARGYEGLVLQLERIDADGVSAEMRRQGRSGQTASLVLLAEVLVRRGEREGARGALAKARVVATELGQLRPVAGVWMTLARLAMREGRYDDAEDSVNRALATYDEAQSNEDAVGALLLRAEIERARHRLDAADQSLRAAEERVPEGHTLLEGRVLAAQGSLALQRLDLDGAEACYQLALSPLREARDQEMEGYVLVGLGEVASRNGAPDALEFLVDGARVLAGLDHRHGLGGALLRVAEHGLRVQEPEFALAAAVCARRLLEATDPVRGVSQAGRLVVKALAALGKGRAVLAAAWWRADLSNGLGKSNEVLDFYRKRAPADWVSELASVDAAQRARIADRRVSAVLTPVLDRLGLTLPGVSDVPGALRVVDTLAARLPRPSEAPEEVEAPRSYGPEELDDTEVHAFIATDLGVDEGDAVLVQDDGLLADEVALAQRSAAPADAADEEASVLFDETNHGRPE